MKWNFHCYALSLFNQSWQTRVSEGNLRHVMQVVSRAKKTKQYTYSNCRIKARDSFWDLERFSSPQCKLVVSKCWNWVKNDRRLIKHYEQNLFYLFRAWGLTCVIAFASTPALQKRRISRSESYSALLLLGFEPLHYSVALFSICHIYCRGRSHSELSSLHWLSVNHHQHIYTQNHQKYLNNQMWVCFMDGIQWCHAEQIVYTVYLNSISV